MEKVYKLWYLSLIHISLVFRFVENPTVTDFSLYIEHVETGNYVKANGVDTALTVDGKKVDGKIADDLRWTPVFGNWNGPSVTFNSKQYPNTRWKSGSVSEVKQIAGAEPVSYTHLDVYKRQVYSTYCRNCSIGNL